MMRNICLPSTIMKGHELSYPASIHRSDDNPYPCEAVSRPVVTLTDRPIIDNTLPFT